MDRFTGKVLSYIKKNNMFSPEDTVVVGFSGGADSTALLQVLYELKDVLKITPAAIHINHGIRKEAGLDEEFCRSFCAGREIPFRAVTEDVPKLAKDLGLTEEEAGRRVRYKAFEDLAKELKAPVIAVAHHKNDVAETLLMNLLRGCGLHGGAAIRPIRDNIVRPLLCVSRSEIEQFLKDREISFCTDKTNAENDHTRNVIRNCIIPELEDKVNPASVDHLARAAISFDRADEFVRGYAQKAFGNIVSVAKDQVEISVKELSKEAEIIRENIVLMCFEQLIPNRKDLGAVHVDAVLSLTKSVEGSARVSLPYGMTALRSYEKLFIGHLENRVCDGDDITLSISEEEETEIEIPGLGRAQIKVFPYDKRKVVPTETYTKWFDYDRIQAVSFRRRRQGDVIRIDQGDQIRTKQVSKFMTDAKIPAMDRDGMYLMADGSEIIWIPGYRMGAAVKVSETTKRILSINIKTGGISNG